MDPEYISMQRACSRCGGLQNVLLLHYGWVCDFCLGGDRMPDYEALGYPETEAREANLAAYYVVAANIGVLAGFWAGSYGIKNEVDAIQKDIRSSSDIVDSGANDSYK